MLTTDQKGNIAELAIAGAAIALGIDVYRPVGEGGRYDMIFELGERLWRVQAKWAPHYRDVIVVRCYSTRRNRDDSSAAPIPQAKSMPSLPIAPTRGAVTSFPLRSFSREARSFSDWRRARTTRPSEFTGRGTTNSRLH
jgi:hypothetical protein